MKRIKMITLLSTMVLLLSGCGSSAETVEIGAWKEELQTYDNVAQKELEDVGNNIEKIASNVGQGIQDVGQSIAEVGQDVQSGIEDIGDDVKELVDDSTENTNGSSDTSNSDVTFTGNSAVADGLSIEVPTLDKSILAILKDQGEELGLDNNDVLNGLANNIAQEAADGIESELEKVSFIKVVDGDTIKVKYMGIEVSVRLIGINTAESVHPDEEKNTQEGLDASEYTKQLTEGLDYVWLEFDKNMYDAYGRLLAYVWTTPDTSDIENMLNVNLIESGYAELMEVGLNNKYAETFEELKQEVADNVEEYSLETTPKDGE